MSIAITCACGKQYKLKDEFVGRSVKCPACGNVMKALPQVQVALGDPIFDRDKFLLRQKALTLQEKYYVWDESGEELLFVERPRHYLRRIGAMLAGIFSAMVVGGLLIVGGIALENALGAVLAVLGGIVALAVAVSMILWLSPKRHVTFYRDDTKTEKVLEIFQDNKFQMINACYTVAEPQGEALVRFRKNYFYNLIRKRWYLYKPDGELLGLAKEDSIILSLLRRVLPNIFRILLRTNFIILLPDEETVIGEFNRKFTLLDRYVLDMSADPDHTLDRRVALALGVMLDTGERR